MERWKGRVAVVTGASAGIGAAISKALVLEGMKVVGFARRVENIQALALELKGCASGGELKGVKVDLRKREELHAAVAWVKSHLGGIDVLVNNAGVLHSTSLAGEDPEEEALAKWQAMLDLNVMALTLLTRAAVQDMRARGVQDGHIVHIGSIVGTKIVDFPDGYAYAGIKHAVRVMTEGLRRELRDLGTKIRVTNLSPGFVRTDWWKANGLSEEESEKMYQENPALKVEDIANAVIFALGCPPHVQIHQLTIQPVGELF